MTTIKTIPFVLAAAIAFSGVSLSQTSSAAHLFADAPEGFIPPPLHPNGAVLETRELADGVYALLSNRGAVDNSGFVIGDKGVLVIDSHINRAMAEQIQRAVRDVTDKPILYLVNTNYHGDHTFGNYVFPASTTIVAQRKTAARMRDFEEEKRVLLTTVNGDPDVYAEARLRLPDLVFDEYLRLDLGGRIVELHHFGAANTPGDTVVYVPEAKVAWTGNFILGEGSIPPLFEFGAGTFLGSLTRMRLTLDVRTIVPGHLSVVDDQVIEVYLRYLAGVLREAREAVRSGKSLHDLVRSSPLGAEYIPPEGSPLPNQFVEGIHRMNLVQTYKEEVARRLVSGSGS